MGSLGIVPNLGQIYNPDSFTGDGSNTTFTLTHLVTSDQSIIWIEGGVVQKPGIDFTISGLTLTRTTAPANLVACFAMYLGVSMDIGVPSDGTITLAKMAVNSIDSDQYVDGSIDAIHLSANSVDSDAYVDGSIDNAHIADDAIDSEHYVNASIDNAHLADDAVGIAELSATGTASSSTFLRGDNAWAAAGGLTTDVVETTYDLSTASGTQDITIADFGTIKAAVVLAGVHADPATSWGIIDGGGDSSYLAGAGNVTAGDFYWNTSGLLGIYLSGVNYQYVSTCAVITDGIRLTWVKGGSATGTVAIFCLFLK